MYTDKIYNILTNYKQKTVDKNIKSMSTVYHSLNNIKLRN